MEFTIAPGAASPLAGAAPDEGRFPFPIDGGGPSQMAAQLDFLEHRGMNVGQRGAYPALRTREDQIEAYRLLWEHKVEGWWNLRADLVTNGICSQEEFRAAHDAWASRQERT